MGAGIGMMCTRTSTDALKIILRTSILIMMVLHHRVPLRITLQLHYSCLSTSSTSTKLVHPAQMLVVSEASVRPEMTPQIAALSKGSTAGGLGASVRFFARVDSLVNF